MKESPTEPERELHPLLFAPQTYYMRLIALLVAISGWHTFWRLVPASFVTVPMRYTGRPTYEAERHTYRLTAALIRRGDDIDRRSYYIYRNIARKYDWLYIKEPSYERNK